jgi:hypothetical protein
MIEIAGALALVACTGSAIAAGVAVGSRYIDLTMGFKGDNDDLADGPLVRPSPSFELRAVDHG